MIQINKGKEKKKREEKKKNFFFFFFKQKTAYEIYQCDWSSDVCSSDLIKKLTNRERDIIVHRFGLDDKTKWTLQKLADKYGITKERVRQIQNTVFEKDRKSVV